MDPVVGREKEIERLLNFKPQKTTITYWNLVVKSAIVEGLLLRIIQKKSFASV
jgi:ATP-dependent Clp protease ATP-binding subunit ClpA